MEWSELAKIIASGRATPEQWDEYWLGYEEGWAREREDKKKKKEWEERQHQEIEALRSYENALRSYEKTLRSCENALRSVTNTPPVQTYYVQEDESSGAVGRSARAATAGIGLGSAIAVVLSFQLNHSIPWAILHGVLSWIYVLYRAWQGNY